MAQDIPSQVQFGISEKLGLTLVGKDGQVKQKVSYPPPIPGASFCPTCGDKLLDVPLLACTSCGKRYVARSQIVEGKLITMLVDLGVE